MLPMILGFLGSAFAPAIAGATGIAALASPLLAGSIGSGLGAAIETGDLKEGLKTGLGSFIGGKLVGGLMGGTAGAAAANAPTAANLAQAQAAGLPSLAASAPPIRPADLTGGSASLFGSGALGQGVQDGMAFMRSPTGIGALMGMSMAAPQPTMDVGTPSSSSGEGQAEMKPIPRQYVGAPEGYQHGYMPEWNYGVSTPYSYEAITNYRDNGVLPYAEGGKAETDTTKRPVAGNEKTEIVDAIMAVKGQHPQPEIALGKFLAKYGEDALRDLVDSVQSGEFDETVTRFAAGEKGEVRGPGDGSGTDDKVPATIDGQQDVLLTEGEFVLRKDATDALEKKYGGGFLSAVNKAGKDAPKVLEGRTAA